MKKSRKRALVVLQRDFRVLVTARKPARRIKRIKTPRNAAMLWAGDAAHADDGLALPEGPLLPVVGRDLTAPATCVAAAACPRAREASYTCRPCSMNMILSASSLSPLWPLVGEGDDSANEDSSSAPALITPPPPDERRSDLASS